MHNAALEYLKIKGDYTKTLLQDGHNLKNHFIKNNFKGANITVPYKEQAFLQADEIKGLANKIGAVNTYIKEGNKIIAYNTDVIGFMRSIQGYSKNKNVLIIGAGGTAKALAIGLIENNSNVTVLNRSKTKLDFFKQNGCKIYDWDNFKHSNYDLVVNSTSAGLIDQSYPAPIYLLNKILDSTSAVFDCIYGKLTPFLNLAINKNISYKDGEDMLLYQGVFAFELFANIKADNKIIEIMKNALRKKN